MNNDKKEGHVIFDKAACPLFPIEPMKIIILKPGDFSWRIRFSF
jgi:hypothetical protein